MEAKQEATVVCAIGAEPLGPGFDEIGLTGMLASEEIDPGPPGTPSLLEAPIFHLYNKRDEQFCYDRCYSEDDLHGPVPRAIVARKNNDDFRRGGGLLREPVGEPAAV